MKYVVIVLRTLLGLMFVVFGLNFFANFIDMKDAAKDWPETATKFMEAVGPSGYMAAVKVLEIVGGAMLLTGFFVPLGLTILGPIIVNITLFHVFQVKKVDPMTFIPPAIFLVLMGFYWNSFRSVFAANPGYCCSGKPDQSA